MSKLPIMANVSRLRIARIIGIPIYVDPTWLIIFALITWSVSREFLATHAQWSAAQNWGAAALASVLFFASVLFHELAHSVLAKRYKIRVISITLFIFGGVARIERDPEKAIQEFNIAAAGPLASGFLAALFFALALGSPEGGMAAAVAGWLWRTNGLLAVFNLLPGFPLDGGRIFRAVLWGATGNYSRATRIAGGAGKLVAYAMILLGAYAALANHSLQSGIWLAFIGWFLLNAAQESVAQLAIRETLSGLRASDVMSQEIPTFAPDHSLEDYAAEVLRTGRRCHLVVVEDRLVGMMSVYTLNSVAREEWPRLSVQAVMIPRERILWASPEEPLLTLLERILSADVNQIPVVSNTSDGGSHIVGMITRDSILRVMQTRSELGTPAPTR